MHEGMDVSSGATGGLTYRVSGLTCSRCVGAALEELRTLANVAQVNIRLVPFGVSLFTVATSGGVDAAAEVRDAIVRAGFRVVTPVRRAPNASGRRSARTRSTSTPVGLVADFGGLAP